MTENVLSRERIEEMRKTFHKFAESQLATSVANNHERAQFCAAIDQLCDLALRSLREEETGSQPANTVTCEQCAFRYGAEHVMGDGKYECPVCELTRLRFLPEDGAGVIEEIAKLFDSDPWGLTHRVYVAGSIRALATAASQPRVEWPEEPSEEVFSALDNAMHEFRHHLRLTRLHEIYKAMRAAHLSSLPSAKGRENG